MVHKNISNTHAIINVENLTYSFNHKENIFENVSFQINKSDMVAIIGANGAGKSTLVKLISNLYPHKKNIIEVYGKISYIPQKINHDPNFPAKVKELLNLEKSTSSTKNQIITSLNISQFLNLQFKNLSGGQQQRVLIALSLLNNPDILILDEPTVGIDIQTQQKFYELLKKLNHTKHLTILFVTHDTSMVSNYFTKTLCVHDKKVCVDDAKNTTKLLEITYPETFHQVRHQHEHHIHTKSNSSFGGKK